MDSGKDNNGKIYWTVLIAFFFGALAFIFYENELFYRDYAGYFYMPLRPPSQFPPVRVTIDFPGGQKRAFEGQVASNITIIAALRAAQYAGRFEVEIDQRGRVTAINGIRNSSGRSWEVYVNKMPISDLPGHIEVGPGDKVVFEYK